jgi:hypothetical protein
VISSSGSEEEDEGFLILRYDDPITTEASLRSGRSRVSSGELVTTSFDLGPFDMPA